MSTLTKDQERALGTVADRVLAAEAADEAERQAAVAAEQAIIDKMAAAREAYLDARARYEVARSEVIHGTPAFLAVLQASDGARADQDMALRHAQHLGCTDLPPKVEEVHGILGFKQSDIGKMLMRVSRMRP